MVGEIPAMAAVRGWEPVVVHLSLLYDVSVVPLGISRQVVCRAEIPS